MVGPSAGAAGRAQLGIPGAAGIGPAVGVACGTLAVGAAAGASEFAAGGAGAVEFAAAFEADSELTAGGGGSGGAVWAKAILAANPCSQSHPQIKGAIILKTNFIFS